MAIGGDQAGSIRIPAAHCGLYGMKPTFGLVPYTGAISSEFVVDHLGPITSTVADNAQLLETLAGPDDLDPRTRGAPPPGAYTEALRQRMPPLSIAVVTEGFGQPNADCRIEAAVRRAAEQFSRLGAKVQSIALPAHRDGLAIWLVFAMEGYFANMMLANGFGGNQLGFQWRGLNDALARWRDRTERLPPNLVLGMLMGQDARTRYRHGYYVKAMNLVRSLRAAYDAALQEHHLLLMPTLPVLPRVLPPADAGPQTVIQLAFENIDNTCPFNLTHHPALSLPCGMIDGYPIGLMLVGRHFAEATLYAAAYGFEQSLDWRQPV